MAFIETAAQLTVSVRAIGVGRVALQAPSASMRTTGAMIFSVRVDSAFEGPTGSTGQHTSAARSVPPGERARWG
jgi:hypothetical protein